MDIKKNFSSLIFAGAFGILVLVGVNLSCLYLLHGVSLLSNTTDRIRDIGTICSIIFQIIALVMGGIYFFNNINYDKTKINCSRRNELLLTLVDEYKEARKYLDTFFYNEFKTDDDLKRFKNAAIEMFATISIFIENSENIFVFTDSDYSKLIDPSSVFQNHHLFSINSIEELKKHDLSLLRAQVSTAVNGALSTCWSGIK